MTKRTRKRPGKLMKSIGSHYMSMSRPAFPWQRLAERQAQSARQRRIKITLPPTPWSKP